MSASAEPSTSLDSTDASKALEDQYSSEFEEYVSDDDTIQLKYEHVMLELPPRASRVRFNLERNEVFIIPRKDDESSFLSRYEEFDEIDDILDKILAKYRNLRKERNTNVRKSADVIDTTNDVSIGVRSDVGIFDVIDDATGNAEVGESQGKTCAKHVC